MMRRTRTISLIVFLLVFVLPTLLNGLPNLITDWYWFDSIGFLSVLRTRLLAQWGLSALGLIVSLAWLGGNLLVAVRLAPRYPPIARLDDRFQVNLRSQIVVIAWVLVAVASLGAAAAVGAQWEGFLRFLNGAEFGLADPIFGRDVGFYVFRWPLLQLVANWWLWMTALAAIVSGLIHVGEQVQTGRIRLQPAALAHLTVLAALFLGFRSWEYHLQRYSVLFAANSALYGAGYTDLHVRLPAFNTLTVILGVAAVLMLANFYLRKLWAVWVPIAIWIVASFLLLVVAPPLVQRLAVRPDELSRERPYIARSIEFTRHALGLDGIQEIPFSGTQSLSVGDLENNQGTLDNVRIWDWRPLLLTYQQLQQIRSYYEFVDVDVERYPLADGTRSVMLAIRELETNQLPEQAQTWLNRHLIYTHGHGLVANAVSEVTAEGLPRLLVRDIPPASTDPALAIDRPEVYFGELGSTSDYVIVGTTEDELDYPKGDSNVYTRYEGDDGVVLKNVWRRIVFSLRFGDLPVLISRAISAESRVLLYRSVADRISTIAPFLWLDNDPYPVIADGRLYWMQDAYTYTDRYPYAAPVDWPGRQANYLRNSVKVVLDAYNGTVTFFAIDPSDPLLQAYQRIYPGLLTSFDEMPDSLVRQVRYPQDLFTIQADMYMTYHMRDPQVFYNREDLWQPAIEVRGNQETVVEPYYVIMRLPGKTDEEFMLMLPMTPVGRDNLIAWLYADSDGDDYGQMGVLEFSKQELIYGPRQIEARIDQDPIISQQLSLWNQRGSQVIRGNMMVIPVEEGLLYVEPIFLQAEGGRMPELKRVIVAHGGRIAMRETLAQSLEVVFGTAVAPLPVVEEGPVAESASPVDVSGLALAAQEHYLAAQQCLQAGDWSCYGQEQEALRETLELLVATATAVSE